MYKKAFLFTLIVSYGANINSMMHIKTFLSSLLTHNASSCMRIISKGGEMAFNECNITFLATTAASLCVLANEQSLDKEVILPLAQTIALSTLLSAGVNRLSQRSGQKILNWRCENCNIKTGICTKHKQNNYLPELFLYNKASQIATGVGLFGAASLYYYITQY